MFFIIYMSLLAYSDVLLWSMNIYANFANNMFGDFSKTIFLWRSLIQMTESDLFFLLLFFCYLACSLVSLCSSFCLHYLYFWSNSVLGLLLLFSTFLSFLIYFCILIMHLSCVYYFSRNCWLRSLYSWCNRLLRTVQKTVQANQNCPSWESGSAPEWRKSRNWNKTNSKENNNNNKHAGNDVTA